MRRLSRSQQGCYVLFRLLSSDLDQIVSRLSDIIIPTELLQDWSSGVSNT